MDKRILGPEGMVVTPHHLATQSALAILREGGTAMEATIAAAATVSVVLPHQNSIGGDGFWLIVPPHGDPLVIQACGPAGSLADESFFKNCEKIPYKGPKSAITVAGVVAGWQEAMDYVIDCGYNRFSAARLLRDAINYAENGYPVSQSLSNTLKTYKTEMKTEREFKATFFNDQNVPKVGERLRQKNLAESLKYLANYGFNDFYNGKLASLIAKDFLKVGMPLTASDLSDYKPVRRTPLHLQHSQGLLFNIPPPSQGLTQLCLLGILDRIENSLETDGHLIHAATEGIKQAFDYRDTFITDPKYMTNDPQYLIDSSNISTMAKKIDFSYAKAANKGKGPADTVWIGIMDNKGFSVSYIQSIYHEFGSEVILPTTGILWHNRGVSFSLDKNNLCFIKPGKLPLHTLMPGAARLNDGRVMVYGSQGGDGQPQFMASLFYRYVLQKLSLPAAISAPRWLYGRIDGDEVDVLTIENRFSKDTVSYLRERGHAVNVVEGFCSKMGNAGALVRYPNGMMEGASDPRCDGSAAGF